MLTRFTVFLSAILFFFSITSLQSQQIEIHPYVPGDVIVKFKDKTTTTIKKSGDVVLSSDNKLNEVLKNYSVKNTEPLFSDFKFEKKKIQVLGGDDIELRDLSKIFMLKLENSRDMEPLIRELKYLDEIEYAEPNYIYEACADPNDELYGDQWYIERCKIDKVWEQTGGTSNQIIGILDTGVDTEHPDLKANCLQGKDFINNDNDPNDDNGHGTHVAGIAAAVGNNGIGICGVNPNAKILPVKVLQSSGRGDAATIAQGIRWAADNGATVINMSFGSYARSQAMEDALAYAYSKAVLVAAAGNDAICIGPGVGCEPFYPAAFQYVLGVKASDNQNELADFTNTDIDGPINSGYPNLLNYEVVAPGTEIMSAYPNNRYKSLQGTSMAAPVIAGALSIYKDLKDESQEMIWARIIGANGTNVFDLEKTLAFSPKPVLQVASFILVDTLKGDGDYRADAGEDIEFNVKIRNAGGNSKTVWMKLQLADNEDKSVATIYNSLVNLGALGAYASRQNFDNPFQVKISNNIVHNRDIVFEALAWEEGSADTSKKELIVNTEKGIEISGVISEDQTWTKDNLYLIVGNTLLLESAILTIESGTEIEIYDNIYLRVEGELIAIGNKDHLIKFMGFYPFDHDKHIEIRNKCIINYCILENIRFYSFGGYLEIRNSILSKQNIGRTSTNSNIIENATIDRNNFIHNQINNITNHDRDLSSVITNNNFWNNSENSIAGGAMHNIYKGSVVKNNSFVNNNPYSVSSFKGKDTCINNYNYWGTSDKKKIDDMIYDFWDNFDYRLVVYEPFLTQPSDSAHGIVWKVLVDGKYPEAGNIDAFGEGEHTFEVYFNRKMDKSVEPFLSFGVREPFTQHAVKTSGSWDAEGKIWTATYYFNKYTGDGINYIRVADAQDDEYFKIPIEDSRFSFVIDAAGAASTIFTAEGGKGQVDLEWEAEPGETSIGYNVYRFENKTDTTYTDTIRVNGTVVSDLAYTDKGVEAYKRYYYMYTSINEDFEESSFSKVVSAVPSEANSVEEIDNKEFRILAVYPNPVQYQGTVELEIYQPGNYTLDIIDMFGNKLMNLSNCLNFGRNKIEFDMQDQSTGMYFIRISDGNTSIIEKFIFTK